MSKRVTVNIDGLNTINDHSELVVGHMYVDRNYPGRLYYLADKYSKDADTAVNSSISPADFKHLFPMCNEFCGYLKSDTCDEHDKRLETPIAVHRGTGGNARMVSYAVGGLEMGISWPWVPYSRGMTVHVSTSRSLHQVFDVRTLIDVTRPDDASLRYMRAITDAVHEMQVESTNLMSKASIETVIQKRIAKAKAIFSEIVLSVSEGKNGISENPFDSKDSFVAALSQHQWARRYGEDRTWAASQWTGREWAGVNGAVLRVASADPKLRPKVEALLKHYEEGRRQVEIATRGSNNAPDLAEFQRIMLRGFGGAK